MMDWTGYKTDGRNPPDEYRRRSFRTGWDRAVAGREYEPETSVELTWDNLGYRMGRVFGDTSRELVDEAFDWCARHYQAQREVR